MFPHLGGVRDLSGAGGDVGLARLAELGPAAVALEKAKRGKKSSLTELSCTQEAPCCSSSQLTPPHRPIAWRRVKKIGVRPTRRLS